jgi:hypothetical protein
VGTAVSLQITATDSASGETLTDTATGLPAGLSISSSGLISGTPATAATSSVTVTATDTTGAAGSATFQRFQNAVPTQFKELATDQAPYGIPSPGNDPAFQAGGADANYFTSYAAANGDSSDSTAQIFGCGGTLSANPPLCAGLNRHVAQLPAAQQTNPATFYTAGPANYYAWFWHQNAINGLQYGFPYDDDAGQSSDISVTNPQYLVVAVGW